MLQKRFMADENSAGRSEGARDEVDVSIVLPTFNEAASLPLLIPKLADAFEAAGLRAELIVVDDASPDGTARVARQLTVNCPLHVIERTMERGLATAVLAGFAIARGTVCVAMDADGSHPVEALPNMVRTILSDRAEIVVGSRHVQGGGSQDWPLFSQLKSRFAAMLALGLTSMTDPTTGLVAVRRSLLEGLALDPVGWKIVLELVVKAHPARLAEVPIVFTDRVHGESKQSLGVLADYVHHLYKLYQFRFPALIEFLKFCLVGLLGVLVDLSVVSALRFGLQWDTRLCQVGGFAAAVTFNYAANRRFSFARAREIPLLYSYVTYVGANLLGLALRMLVVQLLMSLTSWERDHGYGYLLLSALGIVLATLVNFVGVKYFAFAPERIAPGSESTTSTSRPSPSAEKSLARPLGWLAFALCTALVGAATFGSGLRDTRSHDERVNLVMARHIERGLAGLIHPAVSEQPREPWRVHSLPALGNTPVYPSLLALAERLGANWGLALLSSLTFAACLLAIALTMQRIQPSAVLASTLLFATAPWMLRAFSLLEFEPLVAAFGALGFAAITRSEQARFGLLYAALGGMGLGLAFATKMWLALPAFSASLVFLLVRHYQCREAERARLRSAAWIVMLFATGLGAIHLLFVAMTAPHDLALWIERVYLAIFTGEGVTGQKLSEGPGRARSAWAYAGFLLRDHGALLVVSAYGLPALTRRATAQGTAFLFAASAALLSLVPLSVPAFKEPLYLAPALPFLYALAGLCLAAAHRPPQRQQRVQQASAQASLVCAGLLGLGFAAFALVWPESRSWSTLLRIGTVFAWTLPALVYRAGKPALLGLLGAASASLVLSCIELFLIPYAMTP
jgi:dolichol-phosphate mannosyltransferase